EPSTFYEEMDDRLAMTDSEDNDDDDDSSWIEVNDPYRDEEDYGATAARDRVRVRENSNGNNSMSSNSKPHYCTRCNRASPRDNDHNTTTTTTTAAGTMNILTNNNNTTVNNNNDHTPYSQELQQNVHGSHLQLCNCVSNDNNIGTNKHNKHNPSSDHPTAHDLSHEQALLNENEMDDRQDPAAAHHHQRRRERMGEQIFFYDDGRLMRANLFSDSDSDSQYQEDQQLDQEDHDYQDQDQDLRDRDQDQLQLQLQLQHHPNFAEQEKSDSISEVVTSMSNLAFPATASVTTCAHEPRPPTTSLDAAAGGLTTDSAMTPSNPTNLHRGYSGASSKKENPSSLSKSPQQSIPTSRS
ncbi:hypothetical protein BGX31_002154, partial [Mortierella sp. GBA43]